MTAARTQRENESAAPLRAALIVDPEGMQRLQPILAVPGLTIAAQSPARDVERYAEADWYEDPRVMLAQAEVDLLLLATATRDMVGLAAMAGEYARPVFCLPPMARHFGEAVEVARRVREQKHNFWVASWWNCIADDVVAALRDAAGEEQNRFDVAATLVRIRTRGPSIRSWRASLADTPGGVLATDGYALLEVLLALRGLPQRVSAITANLRRQPGEPPRESEGVSFANIHYGTQGVAHVEALWDVPPTEQLLEHHGPECSLLLDEQRVRVRSEAGDTADYGWSVEDPLRCELESFLTAVRAGGVPGQQHAVLERHLAVTALLESIYLSARTGQPEAPLKLYEVQGWPAPRA